MCSVVDDTSWQQLSYLHHLELKPYKWFQYSCFVSDSFIGKEELSPVSYMNSWGNMGVKQALDS